MQPICSVSGKEGNLQPIPLSDAALVWKVYWQMDENWVFAGAIQ
jgi:hypothetical protein